MDVYAPSRSVNNRLREFEGFIVDGPEYLTVFDGATGRERDTVRYNPPRGDDGLLWGDYAMGRIEPANRVDRFLAGMAYLDGKEPSAVFARGYYTRSTLAAYDYSRGKIRERWFVDSGHAPLTNPFNDGPHGRDGTWYGSPAGWLPDRLPLDERTPPRPWNAYALSKLVAEQVAGMYAARHGDAVRLASFRPCYVIAPEEWAGAPTQQGHTVRERLDDPALAAPSLINYVDARDVGDFLLALLEGMGRIVNGETFFVGAADALAREPLAHILPRFLPGSEGLARAIPGTDSAFSSARAGEVLGWSPARSWRTELAGEPA